MQRVYTLGAIGVALLAVLVTFAKSTDLKLSVPLSDLHMALSAEVQICAPGIECHNRTLICGPEYVCIVPPSGMPSPSPSAASPSVTPSPPLTPAPSMSYEPSESPLPPGAAMTPMPSAVGTECNSCKSYLECITSVCHHGKCVYGGNRFMESKHKCFGTPIPHASATPPWAVILAW